MKHTITQIANVLAMNTNVTLTRKGEIISVKRGYLVEKSHITCEYETLSREKLTSDTPNTYVYVELDKNNSVIIHYCELVTMLVYATFTQDTTLVIDMSDKHKYIVRA